jgi:hypothetical protein
MVINFKLFFPSVKKHGSIVVVLKKSALIFVLRFQMGMCENTGPVRRAGGKLQKGVFYEI